MNNSSKYDDDFHQTYRAVENALDSLTRKTPEEMVTLVLLFKTLWIIEGFTDLAQWELIKGALVDVVTEYERIAPRLSGLIDADLEAENYNRRHK